ncbi:unnamed protein product [Zymoseptoria tritici ST99CH_1E4]|uniref:Uncharacterized protein n=1 Tax=Zymoseptoria tritici ST99CH_1E4 TaxID=1276532 RepID=A0A2H1GY80_ZYMTR|nr:unnamed protein product [Zymoseptoria tritici ST99CH_1E4]
MPSSTAETPRFPRFFRPLPNPAKEQDIPSEITTPTAPRRTRSVRASEDTPTRQRTFRASGSAAVAFPRPTSAQTSSQRPHEYSSPHHGSPCTALCLSHLLTCDHKVHTPSPEPCASNCHVAKHPDYSQPRSLDSPFVCPTCLAEHLVQRNDERESAFRAEIEAIAEERGESKAWVEKKVGFMRLGWADEDEVEVSVFYEFGRVCEGFWIDEEWRELIERGSRAWREKREQGKGLHVFEDEDELETTVLDVQDKVSDACGESSPTGSVRSAFEKIKRSSRGLEFRMPAYRRP